MTRDTTKRDAPEPWVLAEDITERFGVDRWTEEPRRLAEEARAEAIHVQAEERVRRRSARRLYMYAIRAGAHGGPIKLGVAADPSHRVQELQTGNPEQLHLLGAWRIADTIEERIFHDRFAAQRLRGEWFAHSDELCAVIRELDPSPFDQEEAQ
jgi:hypothetical protein